MVLTDCMRVFTNGHGRNANAVGRGGRRPGELYLNRLATSELPVAALASEFRARAEKKATRVPRSSFWTFDGSVT